MSLVRSSRAAAGAALGLLLGAAVALSLAAPASADPLPLPSLPLPSLPLPSGPSGPSLPTSLPSLPPLLPVTCTVVVSTPQTISIATARPTVPMKLTKSGCDLTLIGSGTDVAFTSPNGIATTYTFTDASKPSNQVIPSTVNGIFTSNNGHAGFYNMNNFNLTVDWKYSRSVVKFSTRSAMAVTRQGRTIKFGGYVKHFSPHQQKFAGSIGQVAYLQKLTPRGFETVRTVGIRPDGGVRAYYPSAKAGTYRWSVHEAAATWSAVSRPRTI